MSESRIEASAPVRIDLAGGTLDLWPLQQLFPDAVTVNVAIEVRARCRLELGARRDRRVRIESIDQRIRVEGPSLERLGGRRLLLPRLVAGAVLAPRRDPGARAPGFRMEIEAQAPAGSGLGGSSTLAVAIAGACARLSGRRWRREELLAVCKNAEARVLSIPTGDQDYHPALWGGAVALHYDLEGVRREVVRLRPGELERRLVLAHSGVSRSSGLNNWEVFRDAVEGDGARIRALRAIGREGRRMAVALAAEDWDGVAAAMRAEWKARRSLAPGITTPELERIEAAARRAGAAAAKVCGAGGGGCIAFVVPPGRRGAVEAAVEGAGGEPIPVRIARSGLRWVDPDGRTSRGGR